MNIDVNEVEISLYLVSNLPMKEIDEEGWSQCCHTRISTGGRKPGMMSDEIIGDRRNGQTKWRDTFRRPTEIERKRMIAKAVEIGIKTVMDNNI